MGDEKVQPYRLEIKRQPITNLAVEEDIRGFSIDPEMLVSVEGCNLRIIEDLEKVIEWPAAVFSECSFQHKAYPAPFAYCARPGQWPDHKGRGKSSASGYVLVAYAALDDDLQEVVVLGWDDMREDPAREGYPLGWADKFGEPLWEKE